jgi:hypothetical protein
MKGSTMSRTPKLLVLIVLCLQPRLLAFPAAIQAQEAAAGLDGIYLGLKTNSWSSGDELIFEVEPGNVLKRQGREQRYRPMSLLDGLRLP